MQFICNNITATDLIDLQQLDKFVMKDETKCEIKTQGQMPLAVRFSCCATFSVDYENTSIELLSTRQPAMFCQMQLKQSSSKAASFQIRVRFFTLPNK